MRFGRSLDDALESLARRLPSREIAVLMSTLIIQQRAGGDLVRALQDLSSTLDMRRETLREVRTLMAGAVFTSYVVPLLGVGALLMLNSINSQHAAADDEQPDWDRGADRRRRPVRARDAGDQADHEGGRVIDPALTGLAAVCCCAAAVRGMVMMRTPSAIERRELIADVHEPERRRGPMRQLIDLLGARLGSRLLAAMSERRRQSISRRLDLAGRPGGMNLESYVELKAALLALGVALALLLGIAGSWPVALLWLVCRLAWP